MRAQGRLAEPEEFGDIVVRENPDGSRVRLERRRARRARRAELPAVRHASTASPASVIAVFQMPGSNALEVADGITRARWTSCKSASRAGLDYAVTLDTTLPVRAGIKEIVMTLVEAMLLVVLVVFLFLQSWRATLIPLLAVPVSLIGTFAVFPLLGFSINTLSLFGLVLAIGLVVDDAIVVVEAVEHHIEEGMSPRDATLQAMQEVPGPVVAIALILAAVFMPVAFMSGIPGRLYQQFALTIAISVLISAFNALTLSPGALGAAAAPAQAVAEDVLGRFFGALQPLVRARDRRLRQSWPPPDPQAADRLALLVGSSRCRRRARQAAPVGLRAARRTRATARSTCSCPTRRRSSARDAVCEKIDEILAEDRGRAVLQHASSASACSPARRRATTRLLSSSAQAVGRAHRRSSRCKREHRATLEPGASRPIPEAMALRVHAAGDPRHRHGGRLLVLLQDRSGGSIEFLDENLQKFLAAARKRPELAACTRRSRRPCRRCSPTSTATRRSSRACRSARSTRRCRRSSAALT